MKREDYKTALDNVNEWIKAADSKVGIGIGVFSITGALLDMVIVNVLINDMREINSTLKGWIIGVTITSVVLFVAALFVYFWAISPRFQGKTESKKGEKPEGFNSFFYEDVALFKTEDDFLLAIKKTNKEKTDDDLVKEVYHNSCICHKKMHCFRAGLWISFISILFSIISICLALFS